MASSNELMTAVTIAPKQTEPKEDVTVLLSDW